LDGALAIYSGLEYGVFNIAILNSNVSDVRRAWSTARNISTAMPAAGPSGCAKTRIPPRACAARAKP